jgi:Fungal Zn(2)-Cys(6) binuclear cluster domain
MARTDAKLPRSCTLCRKRKLRCNRETPCGNCLRSRNGTCVYESQPLVAPRKDFERNGTTERGTSQEPPESQHLVPSGISGSLSKTSPAPSDPSRSIATPASSAQSSVSQLSAREIDTIRSKIKTLEGQLSNATSAPSQSPHPSLSANAEANTSRIIETSQVQQESRLFGQLPQTISRSVVHKTRLFGQSHWLTGAMLVSS